MGDLMKHVHYTDVKAEVPDVEGIKDLSIRWLITKKDGAENFAMRLFEMEPEGHSPWHQHDWEHEVFVLEGEGIVKTEDEKVNLSPGDALFMPPMKWHQFINTGKETLRFLCLVPYKEE